jgi:hypothetical protein
MPELARWDSFYVIVGSAAGALIGLQFVVMTLMANRPRPGSVQASRAFGTPTVVHFSAVLLLSALLRAPWDSPMSAVLVCGAVGVAGVVYASITVWRMRTQTIYTPDIEDWSFHGFLPLIAYAVLAISSAAAFGREHTALFGVGAATLMLLFIGIHNAWDAVAYQVLNIMPRSEGNTGE